MSASAFPFPDRRLRVLCVDDDPASRQLLVTALAGPERCVEIVNDGREAIDRFAGDEGAFDVLVTDHRLPFLGGLALVVRLRTLGYVGAVVVVTAYDSADLRSAYRQHGASAFCPKPFTAEAIRAAVAEAGDTLPARVPGASAPAAGRAAHRSPSFAIR
jgi:CheY-like chemotaxis protein